MSTQWSSSLEVTRRDAVRFGGAWLVLNLLVFLPPLLTSLPLSPYFPLCVEVLVLVTGLTYAAGTRWERTIRVGSLVGIAGLMAYQAYDAVVYTAFQRNGIIYEDLQFVDNLAYFATDVATWTGVAAAGGGLVVGAALGGLAWWAASEVAHTAGRGGCRLVLLAVHLVAWPLVGVVGPALEWGPVNPTYETAEERTRVRTVATKAWANADASLRLETTLESLDTAPVDSTYFGYDALTLPHRPSVFFFAVESYGTVLERHPALKGPYRRLMARTEATLSDAGWHAATARATAPVKGGRSWLSIASLLTGVRVERQMVYNRFQERAGGVPHLVQFLNRQGYHTVALQPFTFARPGLPVRNLYDFDVTLYRDDLNYRGPPYGLADAPDQYSLQFAHETELSGRAPFFLFFETVDSHALWNYGLPPYLPDARLFNEVDGTETEKRQALRQRGEPRSPFLPDSLTRPVLYDQPRSLRYLRHVAYDLRVVRDYLRERAPRGSLVLLLGDHQPPLFGTETAEVPLHVLSTDSTLVDRVRRRGFTDGLVPTEESPTVQQEGLYSLLVRLLAAHDRGTESDTTGLPPLRPRGVSPALLVR